MINLLKYSNSKMYTMLEPAEIRLQRDIEDMKFNKLTTKMFQTQFTEIKKNIEDKTYSMMVKMFYLSKNVEYNVT